MRPGPRLEEGQTRPDSEILLEEEGGFEHRRGGVGLGESGTLGLEHTETKPQGEKWHAEVYTQEKENLSARKSGQEHSSNTVYKSQKVETTEVSTSRRADESSVAYLMVEYYLARKKSIARAWATAWMIPASGNPQKPVTL